MSSAKKNDSKDSSGFSPSSSSTRVKDVWMTDVEEEFKIIANLSSKYNHIAIAVKHPDNVEPAKSGKQMNVDYDLVKSSVNSLPPIQIAFTFFDSYGNAPRVNCATWQFNLKLDVASKPLTDKLVDTGFDFEQHRTDGIEHSMFSQLLVFHSLVLDNNVVWLSFNGAFDFGYLIRILTGLFLPDEELQFLEMFRLHFQKMYDVRYLMTICKNLRGTLDQVATTFKFERMQPHYYASSDSKLIGTLFFKIKDYYFENLINDNYCGLIYNLNSFGTAAYNYNKKQDK